LPQPTTVVGLDSICEYQVGLRDDVWRLESKRKQVRRWRMTIHISCIVLDICRHILSLIGKWISNLGTIVEDRLIN
jgi:hypothetical protein